MSSRGQAIFFLVAANLEAQHVIYHEQNAHLRSVYDNVLTLDIGRHLPKRSNGFTLATIGRGEDVDIFIPDGDISKLQCSFELDDDRNTIMFCDHSSTRSCQTFGEDAIGFEDCRHPRKVAVLPCLNTTIGMGGLGKDRILFRLHWSYRVEQVPRAIQARGRLKADPRSARTLEAPLDTIVPSMLQTRPFTPGPAKLELRFKIQGDLLGEGGFGKVYRAVDVDKGRLIAVKLLRKQTGSTRNEVNHLSRLNHVCFPPRREIKANLAKEHIVRFFASTESSICMELMDGNLTSLVESGVFEKEGLAIVMFEHTLRGLKRLARDGIIHRDIKPDNILHTTKNHVHHFKIGDFGLANYETFAETLTGTEIYLAPEMIPEKGAMVLERGKQTHKIDVWSLYVTMLWALDINGFRLNSTSKRFRDRKELQKAIESTRSDPRVYDIRAMAEVDPETRASAADMLDMLLRYHKKPESDLKGNHIDPPKMRVEAPLRSPRGEPARKAPLHIPKVEKNGINRRGRKAPPGALEYQRFVARVPGAFPVDIGQ